MREIKIVEHEEDDVFHRSITFDGIEKIAGWTIELAEDLQEFRGIDVSEEIGAALLQEVKFALNEQNKAPLTVEEKEAALKQILEHVRDN